MALFKRKRSEENENLAYNDSMNADFPSLPELPKLPDLSVSDEEYIENSSLPQPPSQLPRYPSTETGNKFSQNTIKQAVSGVERGEEVFEADEFVPGIETQRMQRPQFSELSREMGEEEALISSTNNPQEMSSQFNEIYQRVKANAPVFIRIDKFQESLAAFESTKEKLKEIEKLLVHIKKEREDEEKELIDWETEIQSIKTKIEKVNQDIFSKIE